MPTAYLSPSQLQDLTNVSSTAPGPGDNGKALVWNQTAEQWQAQQVAYSNLSGAPALPIPVASGGTNATTDTAARANLKIPEYTISRGQNLVSNGFGTMGSNYNFSSFTFEPTESYFSPGGFKVVYFGAYPVFSDEFMPVDINKKYVLSYAARQIRPTSENPLSLKTFACGLAFFDADFNNVLAQHHMYFSGTTTELAQPLNQGDTQIVLKSSANWINSTSLFYERSIIFWDYTSPSGIKYPFSTNRYSRNQYFDVWDNGGIVGNVINLRAPWNGPNFPVDTPCSNNNAGPSYKYITIYFAPVPQSFTLYNGTIQGIDLSGQNLLNSFPPGTAYCKLTFFGLEPSTLVVFSASFGEDYSSLPRYTPTSDADSTNTTSGSIVTPGGVGIAKSLFVGGSRVNLANLPTSDASIAVGDLWRDGNDIKVKT